uniref:DNA 3'-5' helicase n=1 Tax=Neogobius melanostomus TaxID=47308 RepID=A0A8C6SJ85_9GOBI
MAHERDESLFNSAVNSVLNDQNHIKSLKPQQLTALEAFLSKEDVFALLPTGFGKSLIYQLAPLVAKKMLYKNPVVVVVSPLLALMEQQVTEASKVGVTAMQIGVNTDEEIFSGKAELLFGSPEAWLLNEKWRRTPIMALTASADVQSRARVIKQLHLEKAVTLIESPNRSNIRLGLTHIRGPHLDCMDWIVQEVKEMGITMSPVLIYCRTIKEVGRVFCYLKAELDEDCWVGRDPIKTLPQNKTRVLSSLSGEGNCKVVVATTALGMGLNFPNISHVVMYGVPEDIEAIVQEIGRAGRNGEQSHAVIYCIKQYTKVDQVVKELLNSKRHGCFRKALYSHFDEQATAVMPGHQCCTYCHSLSSLSQKKEMTGILSLAAL